MSTEIIIKRLWVEIWTLKILLVRDYKTIRNVLLESGKKEKNPYYTVTQSLTELCLIAMWKTKSLSNKIYLLWYISKQRIELLSKKEPVFHDLERVNLSRLQKMQNLENSLSRKRALDKKSKT